MHLVLWGLLADVQATDAFETVNQLLKDHGLTAVIAVLLWRYGPMIAKGHLDFLERTAKLQEQVAGGVASIARADDASRAALGKFADAGQALAEATSEAAAEAVRPHLSAAKQALQS